MMFTNLSELPNFVMVFHKPSLLTVSNAFVRSTNIEVLRLPGTLLLLLEQQGSCWWFFSLCRIHINSRVGDIAQSASRSNLGGHGLKSLGCDGRMVSASDFQPQYRGFESCQNQFGHQKPIPLCVWVMTIVPRCTQP